MKSESTIVDIEYSILPRTVKKLKSEVLKIVALKIMDDYFFEGDYLDFVYMGKSYKNWDYVAEKSSNTYELLIHSLNVITYLTDAYLEFNDKKYLIKAYKIFLSWINYNKKKCKIKKKNIWVDQSASYRLINLLYFYSVAFKYDMIDNKIINDFIIEHLEYLYDYPYTKDNHGIMIDRTLLICSFSLKNKSDYYKYYNKSYYRLREAFYRDFSKKGIHLENSTDYHNFTKKLFIETNNFLHNYNLSLGEDIEYFIANDNFYSYIIKPNKYLPMLGDSSKMQSNLLEKKYKNLFDEDSGLFVLNDENNKEFELIFICGYSKKNHKHYDDLSVNLFYKNDIFIDCGKYNYDNKSLIRKYIKSTQAHNTVFIGENYPIFEDYEYDKKPRIISHYSNNKYDLLVGINNYLDGYHKRYVIYVKPGNIIIYDLLKFSNVKKITQNFNISPDLYVDESNQKMSLYNDNTSVEFRQLLYYDEIMVNHGKIDENDVRGVISSTFNNIELISQIDTVINGSEAEYLTVINLEKKDKIKKLQRDKNKISFTYKKEKINIYF